jgi:glutaredoxin
MENEEKKVRQVERITMYSTSWCPDCRTAKRFLREHGITFDEIDIDENDEADQEVIRWSGGRRVIPTLRILKSGQSEPVIVHNPPLYELAKLLGITY